MNPLRTLVLITLLASAIGATPMTNNGALVSKLESKIRTTGSVTGSSSVTDSSSRLSHEDDDDHDEVDHDEVDHDEVDDENVKGSETILLEKSSLDVDDKVDDENVKDREENLLLLGSTQLQTKCAKS